MHSKNIQNTRLIPKVKTKKCNLDGAIVDSNYASRAAVKALQNKLSTA